MVSIVEQSSMQNIQLTVANQSIFSQLIALLIKLPEQDYRRSLTILQNSTVGQHIRHIIEFYQCVVQSTVYGRICYDERERSLSLETSVETAIRTIWELSGAIDSLNINQSLTLISSLGNDEATLQLPTNVYRELFYCLEHAIHHMAIVRIGVEQTWPSLAVDADFGVAPSTIKYHQQCAP